MTDNLLATGNHYLSNVRWFNHGSNGFVFVVIVTAGKGILTSKSIRSDIEMRDFKSEILNKGFKINWNEYDKVIDFLNSGNCVASIDAVLKNQLENKWSLLNDPTTNKR